MDDFRCRVSLLFSSLLITDDNSIITAFLKEDAVIFPDFVPVYLLVRYEGNNKVCYIPCKSSSLHNNIAHRAVLL